jgi:hypothetical protein
MGTGAPSSGVERPGSDVDHSPISSAEINNAWSCNSTPSYIYTIWCLVRYQGQPYHRGAYAMFANLPTDEDDCLLGCCACSLVEVYRRFRDICCLHHQGDRGGKHLWNVGKLPDYTAQHPRRHVIFILAALRTWNVTNRWRNVLSIYPALFRNIRELHPNFLYRTIFRILWQATHHARGLHSGCGVDGVSKEAISGNLQAHDSSNHRTRMDSFRTEESEMRETSFRGKEVCYSACRFGYGGNMRAPSHCVLYYQNKSNLQQISRI